MTTYFLLDSVTLIEMTLGQRASPPVRASCRIPSVILDEVSSLSDIAELRPLEYATSIAVLEQLKCVMRTLAQPQKIVDLYRNKGNGDALLLAIALAELDENRTVLFPDDWVIVTGDVALTRAAVELGVSAYAVKEFLTRLALTA